jgi:hypothetical protein
MADFSKQWCQINDPESPGDFDIDVIAGQLEPGYVISIICEGFGFIAIGRNPEGELLFAVPTGNHNEEGSEVDWKTLEEVTNG